MIITLEERVKHSESVIEEMRGEIRKLRPIERLPGQDLVVYSGGKIVGYMSEEEWRDQRHDGDEEWSTHRFGISEGVVVVHPEDEEPCV